MFAPLVRFIFLLLVVAGLVFRRKRKKSSKSVLLWDLIVNNDDICFTRVLPRLNQTDVKFLHGVNTETRKLIKRSSREGDLKKKLNIEEMSAISTLEFAWENKSLWSSWLEGHLEVLKYLHETAIAPWDSRAVFWSHENNQTERVQYLLDNKCPLPSGWRYERGGELRTRVRILNVF